MELLCLAPITAPCERGLDGKREECVFMTLDKQHGVSTERPCSMWIIAPLEKNPGLGRLWVSTKLLVTFLFSPLEKEDSLSRKGSTCLWDMGSPPGLLPPNVSQYPPGREQNVIILEYLQGERGSLSSLCYSIIPKLRPYENPRNPGRMAFQQTYVEMTNGRNLDSWVTRWKRAFANLHDQEIHFCDAQPLRFQVSSTMVASVNYPKMIVTCTRQIILAWEIRELDTM